MKVIIQRATRYFLWNTETGEKVQITEEEFKEYYHRIKPPYVNDKHELIYVIKENE